MDIHTHEESVTMIHVSCAVCRHEVPVDEAINAEASDYVAHFCGLECYQRWLTLSHTPGDDTF
ncbi:hypothetical protein DSM104443_02337 [Usitatibacter rugosus]|uniref:DUF3330 domain-containing protein n=1 Tax=Usitatibacter rugosus TaxID=2732067 RepID=A0A6M4GXQ3_9PROT|nr:DUF3330 domain-containing protein [Usitatibacter rugosus]QJR11264.1 hypothetical protein DSM104443_02337 [Usitatibacter rugosus]